MTSPAINAAIPQARSSSAIRRRFPSRASAFVTCASHECHLMPASLRAQDVCTTLDHNESPTEPFKWLRDPSQSPCAAAALNVEARLAYGFDGVVFAVGGYSGKLGKDNYSAAGTRSGAPMTSRRITACSLAGIRPRPVRI